MVKHHPPPPLSFPAVRLPSWQSHNSQSLYRRFDDPNKHQGKIEGQDLLDFTLSQQTQPSCCVYKKAQRLEDKEKTFSFFINMNDELVADLKQFSINFGNVANEKQNFNIVCLRVVFSQVEPRCVAQALGRSKLGLMLCRKKEIQQFKFQITGGTGFDCDEVFALVCGSLWSIDEVYMSLILKDLWILNIQERSTGIQSYLDFFKPKSCTKVYSSCTSLSWMTSSLGLPKRPWITVQHKDLVEFYQQDKYVARDPEERLIGSVLAQGIKSLPTTSKFGSSEKKIFKKLISWQCKKQTNVATSSTKAEYVDAANCCGQVVLFDERVHSGSLVFTLVLQSFATGSFIFPTGRTLPTGPPAILATIDKTPYTNTEDSLRSQLQLADDGGIDDLPIAEIYSGMDNLGKLFANMKLNFEGQPMQLLAAMLPQDQDGEGARVDAQDVPPPIPGPIPAPMPEPDQPQDHFSTPQDHQLLTLSLPPMWKMHLWEVHSMHLHQVSTFVQKVNSLETELKAHKQLFKDVVGKLVKKVKAMEVKLKPKKRKVVVSDSDQDEGGEQAVDLDALIALANAAVTVDSNIPPGGPSNDPAASSHIPTGAPTNGDFAPAHSTSPSRDPFKGKGVVEPSSPISKRTKKQLADERLSEIEAARLEALERERYEKEKAKIARQDAIYAKQLEQEEEMSASQRETRQAEVLSSAKHYSDADWSDIMAQVHANAGLSFELLDADVNEDNFAERMVALINQRKRAFAEQTAKEKRDRPMTPAQQREYMRVLVKNQSTTIYFTGWSMKYVKSLADEQLIAEFEKIKMAVADIKSNELRRTLKRDGKALALDISKKQKSTEVSTPSVPYVPQPQVVSTSKSSGTRRKSLGRSRITKPELDLDADDKTFIKVVSNEDSEEEAPIIWFAFAGWEVISTPLGEINALYMMDQSTKHFTTLREILYIVDRHDLLKLYGLVVEYYENHPVTGAGLIWRLYTLSNVHVLETVSGEVLYMFADVSYPLSVKLMERMLKHKLEIAKDVVGNDMTTAEQLIRFIKNQLVAAQASQARINCSMVSIPRYVVPTGKDNFIVSAGRPNMVPAGRTIVSPGSKDLSRVGYNKWYQSLLRVSG
ncbi:hypothetical protein Tco_0657660 [Tanacetum coccineum]